MYWYLGSKTQKALIAEADEEGMELELDLQFAQRMDALLKVDPANFSANGQKAWRIFMVYKCLVGGEEVMLLMQP